MRKTLVALTLVTAVTVVPGCAAFTSWWQTFKNDPVAQVQTFEATIQVALNAAQLAWPAILPVIPAANQVQAQLQFTNAVSAVNHAEQALNDGVNAAVAAQQSNPNFVLLMQAVSDAVSQVVAIVDLYNGSASASGDAGLAAVAGKAPAAAQSVADLHAAKASLSRWGVKVK